MNDLQMRAFASVSLMLVICLPSPRGWAATDGWRGTMEPFLSDASLPRLSLPEGSKPCKPPQEWQDTDVVCVALTKGSLPRAGYILTDKDGQRVLDFMAPWPTGPVPVREMAREEAQESAQQFARRHLGVPLPVCGRWPPQLRCRAEAHKAKCCTREDQLVERRFGGLWGSGYASSSGQWPLP